MKNVAPLSRRWLRVSILALQRKRNKNNTLKELLRIHTRTVIVETELARFASRLEKKNRENWNENRTLQVEPRILLRWKPSLRTNKLLTIQRETMESLINLFRNPFVGALGSIASIVSLVLAIYFYSASSGEKDLTYYVHPAKTAIVSAGNVGEFSALYKNTPIKGNVSIAKVAFWNSGDEAIRESDILKSLRISTNGKKILEASMTKKSRDVVKITLNKEHLQEGVLEIRWNVLEKNDGAVLQLIYAGSTDENITAESIIVGQKKISQLEYGKEIRTASEQYNYYEEERRKQGFMFLGMGALMASIMIWFTWRRSRKGKINITNIFDKSDVLIVLQPASFIALAVYYLFFSSSPFPPFGF